MFVFVFDKVKPLILHKSLTRIYTQCPYCKYENPDSDYGREYSGLPYAKEPLDVCPACGKQYDMENLVVKKTKEVLECEALGLKGFVKKNKEGQWAQA